MSDDDILTLTQTADFLQVSKRTLRKLATAGDIPCAKLPKSRMWRFHRPTVVKWLATGCPRPQKSHLGAWHRKTK